MSTVIAYRKYGVHKSLLLHNMINYFHFPEIYQDCLSSYYILHWENYYFTKQVEDGTIRHQGKEYIVVYRNCFPSDFKKPGSVKLSFRAAQKEFNLKNYVLVMINSVDTSIQPPIRPILPHN